MNEIIEGLYSVRDVKVERFFPPFAQRNQLEAQRTFLDMCGDHRTPISKHPEDYTLYEIGSFNPETGEVKAILARVVLHGSEAKQEVANAS